MYGSMHLSAYDYINFERFYIYYDFHIVHCFKLNKVQSVGYIPVYCFDTFSTRCSKFFESF